MTIEHAVDAIKAEDPARLERLLTEHPGLAKEQTERGCSLLLTIVDWPGGNAKSLELTKLLLDAGADPNARFKSDGESVLHWAASNSFDHTLMSLLVENGADVDILGAVTAGGTPLDNAVHFGKTQAAKALVDCGASVYNLRTAAGLGRVDLLKSWYRENGRFSSLAARNDPNSSADEHTLGQRESTNVGHAALSAAVFCLEFDAADWLLDHGVNTNVIPEGCDSTLLAQIAYRGSLPMAMYLVARGADLDIPSPVYHSTPFQYGFVHGHPDIMNFLIDQGSKLDLKAAAQCGRLDLVMKWWDQCEDPAQLLKETEGDKTAVGKPIHPELLKARAAVAKFIRLKMD